MTEKIIRLLGGFIVGIVVARYLQPSGYGLINFSVSVVGLIGAFVGLGLDNIIIKRLVGAADKSEIEKIVSSSFFARFLAGIFAFSAIFVFARIFYSDPISLRILVIVASILPFYSFDVFEAFFKAKVRGKIVGSTLSVAILSSLLLRACFVIFNFSVEYFAFAFISERVIKGSLLYLFFRRYGYRLSIKSYSFKLLSLMLRESYFLMLSTLVVVIYMRTDQIMLNFLSGTVSVGLYSVSVKISETWYFIPVTIVESVFPAILKSQQDKVASKKRLMYLLSFLYIVAFFVSIVVYFFADYIIVRLYGVAYAESAKILKIHIWSGIFVSMGLVSDKYIIANGITKKSFYRTASGAFINIILNFVFIPLWGIMGAAIATLVAQICANYLYDFFDKDLWPLLKLKNKAFLPFYLFKRRSV